ncbi:neurofilament heavy polypeptide-like [Pecten maximus]|uniref:neurofilament heavy polypeptide-like n=1 Tax=Pecten maximus TaxID=6579 RepID=UPI001458C9FB|nr:neurofilament heavy polypeptide-like [Pecten maximus]
MEGLTVFLLSVLLFACRAAVIPDTLNNLAETPGAVSPAEAPGLAGPAELPGIQSPSETTGVEVPAETPGVDGLAETPGVESPAQTPRLEGPAETPVVASPAETPGLAGPAETPGAASPAETPGAASPAETPGVEIPAESPKVEGPAETPGAASLSETPGVPGPAELPGIQSPSETTGVEVPAETPGVDGLAETPGVESQAETPRNEGQAETPVAASPAETPGLASPAETPGAASPAETPGAASPAETPGVEIPAESPKVEGPAETPGVASLSETPGVPGPAESPGIQSPAESSQVPNAIESKQSFNQANLSPGTGTLDSDSPKAVVQVEMRAVDVEGQEVTQDGAGKNTQPSDIKQRSSSATSKMSKIDGSKSSHSSASESRLPASGTVNSKAESSQPVPHEQISSTVEEKKQNQANNAKSASTASKKRSRTSKILEKLSTQSLDRLKTLVLSKTLKSKNLRRLVLVTYVKKAKEEGMVSDSIYGRTRLEQSQMNKLLKLDKESVKKLLFRETRIPERMRKNALKVYLKMSLPSRSEVKAKTDKDIKAEKVSSPPPGVKVGGNVAPWSQENENFPMQTHAKPHTPTFNEKQSVEKPATEKKKLGSITDTSAVKVKEKPNNTRPGHVKFGDNVAPWSQENDNSKFPMQTHAKPFVPAELDKPVDTTTINKKPDVNLAGIETKSTKVNSELPAKQSAEKDRNLATPPGSVKTGENVAPWSKENENSKFPMQTHAKPPTFIDLPDITSVKLPEKQSTEKDSNLATPPGSVKTGENVAPWSKENENSKFPMQTHAKPPTFIDLPDITSVKLPEKQSTEKDSNLATPPGSVKTGENVAPWSKENENSKFPMQTHAKPDLPMIHTEIPENQNTQEIVKEGQTSMTESDVNQGPVTKVQSSSGGMAGAEVESIPDSVQPSAKQTVNQNKVETSGTADKLTPNTPTEGATETINDEQISETNKETQLPTSEVKPRESNADMSFSSPVVHQIPVPDKDTSAKQDKSLSSSFQRTSQVLSMVEAESPTSTSNRDILSDKDISAVVSSFF